MLLNNDIAQSILNRIVLLLNILRKHIPISTHLTVLPSGRIVNNNKISILKLLSFSRSYHSSANLHQKRLTNLERSKFTLSDYLKAVLVGNILGDVYMRRFLSKANTRLTFRQGSINAEYLLYLYGLFQHFVTTPPSISSIKDKITGKTRYNLSFTTLALPCFNQLYETFYVNGKKIIPANIAELLTPVSLAFWIMDDGGFTGSGLKLYTNAFSSSDLDLLIDALDKNFGIKATINKSSIKDQQTLYISKKQLPLVVDLVKDHMHPSMLYKLNITQQ